MDANAGAQASPASPRHRAGASAASSSIKREHNARLQHIDDWSHRCDQEDRDAATEAMKLEHQLQAALQSTQHLGTPNAFRTAICFDVMAQIAAKFGRYDTVLQILQRELARAVYVTEPPTAGSIDHHAARVQRFFSQPAFFSQLQRVLSKKAAQQRALDELDALHARMVTQLRNQERMVDTVAKRWARVVLKQTLVDWKKIIVRKKYTRVLLAKTSARWGKQRMLRLFRLWVQYAKANKVARTKETLQQCADQLRDFEELLTRMAAQIDHAKQETRVHREHYDFAKRQIISLEELLGQLEQRVHNSNERKLQAIVNEWGRLCLAFVDCQLEFLQNMLDAVSLKEYADSSLLLVKGEELADLLHLPGDALVLRWINYQLVKSTTFQHYAVNSAVAASPAAPSSIGFMQNFGSDMRNNYVLRHVLYRIVDQAAAVAKAETRGHKTRTDAGSPVERRRTTATKPTDSHGPPPPPPLRPAPYATKLELRATLEEQLCPPCPAFLSMQVIGESETPSDLSFALFSFLATEHPTLIPTGEHGVVQCPWSEARIALEDARSVWSTLRSQWTELQTPFAIRETVSTSPDLTSPPQLLVRGNIALQNAVNMVQYACSKRSALLKTWGFLQRSIQQDAMRVLVRRGRQDPPLEMMDRRRWREKYMLTTLHMDKLLETFEAVPKEEQADCQAINGEGLREELRLVEGILTEFHTDLRRVYRYYASIDTELQRTDHLLRYHKNGGPGGGAPVVIDRDAQEEERFFRKISMSMSLVEFHVFLKDCHVFGTARPFPYDFIQKVFEQVNIEVTVGDHVHRGGEDPLPHGGGSASEMTPAEFVEALVHVARSKFLRLRHTSHAAMASLSLSQRFRRMLVDVVLPNAMQEKERVNVFHEQLLSPQCKEALGKHQRALYAMYTRFAGVVITVNTRKRQQTKMLSVDGLVVLLKHYDLLREGFINLDDVQHILSEVLQLEREGIQFNLEVVAACLALLKQAEQNGGRDGEGVATTVAVDDLLFLTFAEFVEVVSAIACYLRPDAFVPLAEKLEDFFVDDLQLRQPSTAIV